MKKIILVSFLALQIGFMFAQTRQLEYFTQQAIANSPLLKELQNQATINQLDSLLIRAAQRPQVSFISNNSYAPVVNGIGYDDVITNGANVNALFSVNQSLINNRFNKVQFANLALLKLIAANNMAVSEQDIKKTIISQYITTYGDLLQLNYIRETQAILTREEKVLKNLTEKNIYKQSDYLLFYINLQQNDFKLQQASLQYKNNYCILNYLAGVRDTAQPLLESPDINIERLPAINQSVFFKKYQLDSLALLFNKTMIDVNYRPRLHAFADAGYNSSLKYKPYKNVGVSIGLSLLVPIYDGKQKKIQYARLAAQENTRRSNQQFFSNQYEQQCYQLQQKLKGLNDLTANINLQLKYIETLLAVNQKLLQTGDVRIYDYIITLNNFLSVKSLINENAISRLQIVNQLNYWDR